MKNYGKRLIFNEVRNAEQANIYNIRKSGNKVNTFIHISASKIILIDFVKIGDFLMSGTRRVLQIVRCYCSLVVKWRNAGEKKPIA